LPQGFVATALSGDLPARLENDGHLRVQLRPGHWTLTLLARSVAPLEKVGVSLPPAPWPKQEVWSYADDNALRGTRIEGNAVDAAQAGVPDDWASLPAYVLDDRSGLRVEQGNRGNEGGQGDALHLRREMWLDFDGRSFSVSDRLSGELRHHQRIGVGAPWQLQRASENGDPLLITRDAKGQAGVELRDRRIDVAAGLRLPAHAGAIPSSGWQLPLDGIEATVHLPHGYLALAQHEAMAPRWTLALALAFALLLRALPEGRLRTFARGGALALFALAVLWALPFTAAQLQYALHPQLEEGVTTRVVSAEFIAPPPDMVVQMKVPSAMPAPPSPPAPPSVQEMGANAVQASPEVLRQVVVTGSSISVSQLVAEDQDNRSVIQAGAGTPHWNEGNNYRLGWSGPVTPQQTTRLVIAPVWLVRLLRV